MKEHELACTYKISKPLHESLRDRNSSLDLTEPLQASPIQHPVISQSHSLLNTLPFGNISPFAANNQLNQFIMYQNLFPHQIAARFRSLAENALQEKTERIQFPCLIPQRSVSSSTKSFTKSEDGLLPGQNHAKQDEEENHHRMLSTERNLLTSQSTETKIPGETLLPKCRKRSRSEESETETEPATKRSKESDEDNEEVIVDVRNPDSCSEHESEHAPTNSDINHENSEQKTPSDSSKDEDLIVYVKGKRTVIYSCHICDCFFLKESAHSIHMGAHMGSIRNLQNPLQLGKQITGALAVGIH